MNRRSFLKRALALSASGLLLPETVAAEPKRRVWAFPTNPLGKSVMTWIGGGWHQTWAQDDDAFSRFVRERMDATTDEYRGRIVDLRTPETLEPADTPVAPWDDLLREEMRRQKLRLEREVWGRPIQTADPERLTLADLEPIAKALSDAIGPSNGDDAIAHTLVSGRFDARTSSLRRVYDRYYTTDDTTYSLSTFFVPD